jgi:hypothetical protein
LVSKVILGLPQGGKIRGLGVRVSAKISTLSAVLVVGACAMPDTDSFRAPDASTLFRPMSVTNYKDRVLPPVASEDLVDANGGCAGAAAGAGVPPIPAAIALEMTECDVVKRAGIAERAEIGTSERGERTARLTYINGQRPGIYYFTAGRLTTMERAPEPAAPQRPAKKPAKRAAQQSGISVQ